MGTPHVSDFIADVLSLVYLRTAMMMTGAPAIMDARLGGMKEALKLTANQYPLWEVFETAVKNGDQARTDDMREMMQNRERLSPADRLDVMAGHMDRRAAELKEIAEAAKPFYASMDDTQKRTFGLLCREMLTAGTGVRWVDAGGDAGGAWEPEHWELMQ